MEEKLRKRKKRTISIEKGKLRGEEETPKGEGIKAEVTETVIKKPEEEKLIEVALPPIPTLQKTPFKEIRAKIKAFFTEIPEIKPTIREIPKIRIKTKPFRGASRKFFAFNITIPTIEQKIFNLAVPNLATKYFYGLKAQKIDFNLELAG